MAILYTCSNCGPIIEASKKGSAFDQTCIRCGDRIHQYTIRANPPPRSTECRVDALMKENERWSWSMGVHVDQIPEMMKANPESQYHPQTGQLLIKSRHHKIKEMKRRGYDEYN